MQRFLLIIILSLNSALAFGQAEFGFSDGPKQIKPSAHLPELVLDKAHIDLGQVKTGSSQLIEFTITNKGEARLVISDIQTGYGCYVDQYPTKEIKENESSVVRFRLTPIGTGSFTKTIVLTANIEGGTKTITIKGHAVH